MRGLSRRLGVVSAALLCAVILQAGASAQKSRTAAPAAKPQAPPAARTTPTPSDFKIRVKMGMGGSQGDDEGRAFERTEYIHGARQRTETGIAGGPGSVMILQCDLRRYVMVNDRAKTYMFQPVNSAVEGDATGSEVSATTQTTQKTAQQRGGIVTITTTFNDTGERQQMFGYTARHLKSTMTKEASPDACDRGRTKVETDGWYIDLHYGINCFMGTGAASVPGRPARPGCADRYVMKGSGAGTLGYLVKGTNTYTDEAGRTNTMTTEVLELSRAPLDAALFEPPAGYTEAKSYQEFAGVRMGPGGMPAGMMPGAVEAEGGDAPQGAAGTIAEVAAAPTATTVGPKRPGVIRVGVAPISNRAGREVSAESLRAQLVNGVNGSDVEAVPLAAADQAAAESEARQKQCDFILYTDLVALKQSAAGKMGGMFGRVAGAVTGGDRYESRVEFRLVPASGGAPQLESNATAKEEGAEASVGAALEREAKAVAAAARKKK